MASKQGFTDSQRILHGSLDAATELALAYAAPEVPSLENKTPQGLLEDFGRLNEARKAIEKTEKIVKERLGALLGAEGKTELRGDNFTYKKADQERTALNQTAAKEYFTSQGTLSDYMATTSVSTVTVKRN